MRFVRPGPSAVRAAGARVERLRAAEDRRATGRARTPWKRDHVDATGAMRAGKVYSDGFDALDVIEDQREAVNPSTRPIAAVHRDRAAAAPRPPPNWPTCA